MRAVELREAVSISGKCAGVQSENDAEPAL